MQTALTKPAVSRKPAHGFTLIELLTVMTVVGLLVTIGLPAMSDFVADQRVRTTASDLASEISYARSMAIETSRRVYIERTGVLWSNGWRVYADINGNAAYDAGVDTLLKVFDGFASGNVYVCSTVTDFANQIALRPDGRVQRNSVVGVNDGIYVVDTQGGSTPSLNKIRGLIFGLSGRVTTVKLNGTTAPC